VLNTLSWQDGDWDKTPEKKFTSQNKSLSVSIAQKQIVYLVFTFTIFIYFFNHYSHGERKKAVNLSRPQKSQRKSL